MKTLVVGASGATGKLLVQQLLERGGTVRVVVRTPERLPQALGDHDRVELVRGSVLEMDEAELALHVAGCDAVASCLGHNLSFAGIFGPPRRLVTDSVRRLCGAIRVHDNEAPTRFVLMGSTGVRSRDHDEPVSLLQQLVLLLLRIFVPPHRDNEMAAEYLSTQIGQIDPAIEWVAVRPDTLVDEGEPSPYDIHPSPVRSAIFDPGRTSRINVAHFMAELITDESIWNEWKGQMPVIYDASGASTRD